MMAAVLPSSTPIAASKPNERHSILTELLDAVKQCQIRFGGRAELATESDLRVAVLCNRLESALSHGLRCKPLSKNSSTIRQVTEIVSSSLHLNRGQTQDHLVFWHYVREHLTRHEFERYLVLKQVWTDTGRGRAWLRSALNERSLERYLHSLLGSAEHISVFYEDWSFLADQERSSMLTTMAAGLGSILFAISIDNLDLNQPRTRRESPEPIVSGMSSTEPAIAPSTTDDGSRRRTEQRRRRRVPANIISFDDDDEDGAEAHADSSVQHVSSSAPSTCLSSPAAETTTLRRQDHSPSGFLPSSVAGHETTSKRPTELRLCQPSSQPVPSSKSAESPASSKGASPDFTRKSREPRARGVAQTLTPVNSVGVGELIPVPRRAEEPPSEEDSASVPSLSEDVDCMRNGEVRQAVLSLLSHKDDLQAEAHALRRLLESANEANAELQAEHNETLRSNKERLDRLDTRIQALTRENELLKHQLRKYVAAVQMLKRDGTQAHEALATLEVAQAQAPAPDYHHEAQEYEKKLIQVAEMHGELMEFNERLHRLILRKDASLRRLREELVELRGPLPDDDATDDDEASVVSEPSAAASAAARTLVNIWIPSAFLTGGSADVHHVYQVFIRIRDDEWNIYRRYSQFHSLHKELKKKDSAVATLDFPPKKTLGNKDACFVEERRRRLQHYLRCVVNQLGQSNVDLATSPDKDLLISLVPFFGEASTAVEDRGRRKRANSRNPFSRLGRNHDANQPSVHSPQYTGL